MSISCYAAMASKASLQPFEYDARSLGKHEVEIKITHCGICHSDIHLIDNDWGVSSYPLVPGHEIIGVIGALGDEVKNFQLGDRVGVGWERGSCGHCEWCAQGLENSCASQQATCVGHHGGFAESIRLNSHFVFKIPESLSSERAAPLLCGGITVYSPLKQHVRSPMKVGIIGVGGLGHMAIQFAHAFGCEVTAFSSSANKEEEAKKLGADKFVNSSDAANLKKLERSLDFILCTVSAELPWLPYVNILRPYGKLCFLSGLGSPLNIPVRALIHGRKSIVGSNIGSCPEIKEMLEFAARHDIGAQVEVMPMAEVNNALAKVRNNQARYRMVLEN